MEPVDFFSPEFKRAPYPHYARMRAESPVVRLVRPDGQPIWLVTRYDDVVAVMKDERFKKDFRKALTPEQVAGIPPMPEVAAQLSYHMLASDPPDHTRLRNLVSKAFAPRLIQALRPRIQSLADGLIDAALPRGEMDLLDDFAFPIPITIIAELLGVPAEDHDRFRVWSNAVVADRSRPGALAELATAAKAFAGYLSALFVARRAEPRADLVTALVQAEEAGDRLSERELLSTVFLLLVAGHETTVNLIANGVLALLTHPAELARLRADPALITSAVEELMRFDNAVETSTMRFTSEDVEVAGTVIPRGALVLVVIGSANRDPSAFSEPDKLDLGRPDNRHLGFGHGLHYCIGAALARLEGQIAIGTLVQRLPGLRLAQPAESLEWRPSLLIRGMVRCPLQFD